MKIQNIKSDKVNILRWLKTEFDMIINRLKFQSFIYRDGILISVTNIHNNYKKHLSNLLESIQSDNDYRINLINERLSVLSQTITGVVSKSNSIKTEIGFQDLKKFYLKFIETEFSNLLKIDVLK